MKRMRRASRQKRIAKRKQRYLNRKYAGIIAVNLVIVAMLMLIALLFEVSENNKIEGENKSMVYESEEMQDHDTVTSPANTSNETEENEAEVFCRNLSDIDKYILAKMAMAEAEGESLNTKVLVILTILNRVESDKSYFPDTIWEVILQRNSDGTYQFTPIGNGRWDRVEPNEECWQAVEIVNYMQHDISQGALYFEACSGESWHSRNLEFICQSDNTRFYK